MSPNTSMAINEAYFIKITLDERNNKKLVLCLEHISQYLLEKTMNRPTLAIWKTSSTKNNKSYINELDEKCLGRRIKAKASKFDNYNLKYFARNWVKLSLLLRGSSGQRRVVLATKLRSISFRLSLPQKFLRCTIKTTFFFNTSKKFPL